MLCCLHVALADTGIIGSDDVCRREPVLKDPHNVVLDCGNGIEVVLPSMIGRV